MKRITSIILTFILLFTLIGCQGKNTGPGITYLTDFYDMESDIYISTMKRVGDSFYLVCKTENAGKSSYHRLIFNLNDKSTSKTPLELVIDPQAGLEPGNYFINDMIPVINPDGTIETCEFKSIMNENWEILSEESWHNLYDINGELISSEPFKEKFDIPDDANINLFQKDCNGNYLIGGAGEPLKIYSADFQKLGEVADSSSVGVLCENSDGVMVASWIEEGKFNVAPVDTAQCKMGDSILLDKEQGSNTIWPGSGNMIYFENGSDIYSCDVTTGEQSMLFSCSSTDLSVNFIHGVYPLENGRLLIHYNDYMNSRISMVILTPEKSEATQTP